MAEAAPSNRHLHLSSPDQTFRPSLDSPLTTFAAAPHTSMPAEPLRGKEDSSTCENGSALKGSGSPAINPFHLLTHPNDSGSTLPPLSPRSQPTAPHSQQLPNPHRDPMDPSPSPPVRIVKVSKDQVHLIPGDQATAAQLPPVRVLSKVGKIFRRGSADQGQGQGAVISGQAPPSPPLSEVDDDEIEENEIEEVDDTPGADLSRQLDPPNEQASISSGYPLTDVNEVKPYTAHSSVPPAHLHQSDSPTVFTRAMSTEPEDIQLAPHSGLSPQRVASGSSTRTTGSLAVVRNSRRNLSSLANGSTPRRSSGSSARSDAEIGQMKADEINAGLEPPLGLEALTTPSAVAGLGLGLPGQNGSKGKKLPTLPMASIIAQSQGLDGGQLTDSPADYHPPAPLPSASAGQSSGGSPQSFSGAGAGPSNYLHPSSASSTMTPPSRVQRRNTNPTPNTPPMLSRSPLVHSHSTLLPPQSPVFTSEAHGMNDVGAALDPDILAQAEEIRRERISRRQKKLSANEEAVHPHPAELQSPPQQFPEHGIENPLAGVKAPPTQEETKVLVGNLIGEDHVNYVLMYNMLTGIRIGVSRCQAKIKRPLTEEDFTARHKFSFDIVGNELTPSARYDFKFKDYSPWVFRDLRDEHFHLDPADYLLSLTAKYILSELGSPGKSGSFFYFSRDYRFIIKTISHSEHKFLRSILKDYHEHIKTNPHTLLSRFYGLHRVKLPRGRKIHFVIMNNLFPPHRDIHETFDLKGSAYGREYPEDQAKTNPKAVLKDLNWVNRGRTLELGPEKRALFSEQLRRDMEFLKKMKVMDYSLLVGIHNMERGNRDNLRENRLHVFHPDVGPVRRKPSSVKGPSEASHLRKAIHRSDPKTLDVASQLPTADSADRRHFLFYQDEGGLRATDESNQNLDQIYYLGVIDICTPYNMAKRVEHFWKGITEDRISCVDPVEYGTRFINFLYSVMRGGDMSLRPEGLKPIPPPTDKEVGDPSNPNRVAQEREHDDGHRDGLVHGHQHGARHAHHKAE